jgi:hypothetical protein
VILKNKGKWCIRSQEGIVTLVKGGSYRATWDGVFLDLEIPQLKGKAKVVAFEVFDYNWRNVGNLPLQ